jgi:hypothetical protein
VEVAILLLARFQPAFESFLEKYPWIHETEEALGRIELPGIDAGAATQAVEYLEGKALVVKAADKGACTIDERTFSVLVQLSSFAHLLGIGCLQESVMHALWHFLVMNKKSNRSYSVEGALMRLRPGCPASVILEGCENQVNAPFDGPQASTVKATPPATGSPVDDIVITAMLPETIPDWSLLTDDVWSRLLSGERKPKKGMTLTNTRLYPRRLLDYPPPQSLAAFRVVPFSSRSATHYQSIERQAPSPWEGMDIQLDRLVAGSLPRTIRYVRAASSIPVFNGFDIMATALGCRFLTVVLLTQYSSAYRRAIQKGKASFPVPSNIRGDALVSIAGFLLDLGRTSGRATDIALKDTAHAIEVERAVYALQMDIVHRRLVTSLYTRLDYSIF